MRGYVAREAANGGNIQARGRAANSLQREPVGKVYYVWYSFASPRLVPPLVAGNQAHNTDGLAAVEGPLNGFFEEGHVLGGGAGGGEDACEFVAVAACPIYPPCDTPPRFGTPPPK